MEGKQENDHYASGTGTTIVWSLVKRCIGHIFCRVPGLPWWLGNGSLVLMLNSRVAGPVPVNKIRSPRPLVLGSAHVTFDLSL